MAKTDQRLSKLLEIPADQKTFENTLVSFEQITADLDESMSPVTFMKDVSLNKDIRVEAEKCEADLGQYVVGLYTRRDLYKALVTAEKNSKKSKLLNQMKFQKIEKLQNKLKLQKN